LLSARSVCLKSASLGIATLHRQRLSERDAAGRITAVDLTETFTTRQGAVIFRAIGRLVAEGP